MGIFVAAFYLVCHNWTNHVPAGELLDVAGFLAEPLAPLVMLSLLLIAIAGGMFVVPLYAFLTTFVDKTETARTIAANNIVNSGAMVLGAAVAMGLSAAGLPLQEQVLLSAVMCVISALLGAQLYRSERAAKAGSADPG
jgi:Kef-type K+ transport system membrane component KefB